MALTGLKRPAAAVLGGALLCGAAPPPQAELVLDCYLAQSGRIELGQFVRHLQVDPERGIVSIADGLRGEPPRWLGNASLVTLNGAQLVFDFASAQSAGRTTVDRKSGRFLYRDGRAVVTGTCQPSAL